MLLKIWINLTDKNFKQKSKIFYGTINKYSDLSKGNQMDER